MAARRNSPCASSADTSHEGPGAMTVRMNWREDAACGDADPDLFFPIGTTGNALRQMDDAKRICRFCPVRIQRATWIFRDAGIGPGAGGTGAVATSDAGDRTTGAASHRARRAR